MAVGLLLTLRHIDGVASITPIVLGLLFVAVLSLIGLSLRNNYSLKLNYWLLAFVIVSALSLLIGRPQPLTACWLRLSGFVIALAAISPLIQSEILMVFRNGIWKGWWLGSILLTALSFVVLIISISTSTVADYRYFGFKGVMSMGMALSPIAALTAIYALYNYLFTEKNIPLWQTAAWLVVFGLSVITAVAGGSRIAIAGLIVASAILLFFAWRRRANKRTVAVVLLSSFIVLIAVASPLINTSIAYKNSMAMGTGSIFSSRTDKWEGRIAEFESSPLTGIGFSAQTIFNSQYDNAEDTLKGISPEPGSSWLSLLAQTGILGTVCFLAFLVPVINKLLSRPHLLLLSVFAFLLLNGCCEGWLLYSSALLFPVFWILTSIAYE